MNYLYKYFLITDYGQEALLDDEIDSSKISYKLIKGMDNALYAYVDAIRKNTKNSIDIHILKDNFNWENPHEYLDGDALFSWDPYFSINVLKVDYIYVPIILIKEAKRFFERFDDLPIDVYEYHGNIKNFFSANWKDFLGEIVY